MMRTSTAMSDHEKTITMIAAVIGIVVGWIQMLADAILIDVSFSIALLKVLVTAIVGGAGGVIGKLLIDYMKKRFIAYLNRRNERKNKQL